MIEPKEFITKDQVEALKQPIGPPWNRTWVVCLEDIKNLPAVDPVVRCKDCYEYNPEKEECELTRPFVARSPDYFCGNALRRVGATYCTNCKTEWLQEWKYCPNCGSHTKPWGCFDRPQFYVSG